MENERNVEQRPEYFCLHKLDDKCSRSGVFLSDTARRGGAALHLCHACTYSCLRASTCSMLVIPARAKLSLYWLILMDSSHSGTERNVVPSQPLVLGRRMETLRSRSPVWSVVYSTCEGKSLFVFSEHSCDFRTVGQSWRWVLMTPDFVAACPKS